MEVIAHDERGLKPTLRASAFPPNARKKPSNRTITDPKQCFIGLSFQGPGRKVTSRKLISRQ
jgi:hypothetical protein